MCSVTVHCSTHTSFFHTRLRTATLRHDEESQVGEEGAWGKGGWSGDIITCTCMQEKSVLLMIEV